MDTWKSVFNNKREQGGEEGVAKRNGACDSKFRRGRRTIIMKAGFRKMHNHNFNLIFKMCGILSS
jgi:hypothetical protein